MKPNNIKLTPNNLEDLEKTFLWQYREAIKNGEIQACFYLKKELDNLIEDLSNEDYYYDTKEAYKRITFITECLRMSKAPFHGAPFKLELFQLAYIEVLYSFYMSKDNTQRFQKSLFLLARKNGKSTLCAALALAEMIIGDKGSDIVVSSNDDNQASIITEEIDSVRQMIDPKNKLTWRNQKGMKCFLTGSKIFKLSDRTRNKEGRNISWGVLDEAHEMKDNVILKSIEQSQSLKPNPKLIIITTSGFVNDGVLDNELARARGIIDKEIEDSASVRYLPWIYEMDGEWEVFNGTEENRLWQKANPLLFIAKQYSYLDQQVSLAKQNKSERIFVLCKDFNIKQNSSNSWLALEDYNYETTFDLEDFRGSICLGAVDIAETTDLTSAKIIITRPNDRKKYIHSMYWIPEGKLEKSDDSSVGAKYTEWASQGLLRIEEGNYLNPSVIADWFFELYKKYGLRIYKIGYDVRFCADFINRLEDYGFEHEMILQKAEVLSQPISMTEVDLKDKLVIGLNEMDKWCLGNCTLRVDSRGYGILEKIKGISGRRIDGAATLVDAYEMMRRYRQVLEQNN